MEDLNKKWCNPERLARLSEAAVLCAEFIKDALSVSEHPGTRELHQQIVPELDTRDNRGAQVMAILALPVLHGLHELAGLMKDNDMPSFVPVAKDPPGRPENN